MVDAAPPTRHDWINRRTYPFSPRQIEVEGGLMSFVDEGVGRTVLFVHGNPTWSYQWRNYIRQFRTDGFRCIAPDHIGFGLSEKPSTFSHHPAAHSRNLRRLVEELDLRDILLVVHDIGGPIGLNLVTEMPDRFSGIVAFNTWFWDLKKDAAVAKIVKVANGTLGKLMYHSAAVAPKMVKAQFSDKSKYSPELDAALQGPFLSKESRTGPLMLTRMLTEAGPWFDEVWHNREAFIAKPFQIIWGTKDPVFGLKSLDRVWHEASLAEVTSLDAGSFVMEERSQEVYHAMRNFLCGAQPRVGYLA